MKNKLLNFAGALAALAILGHFYAKPLLAQVRAALVKNVDEHGRVPYQQSTGCSPSPSNCEALFPAVPSNRRLVIEYVSALVISPVPPQAILTNNVQQQNWFFSFIPTGPTAAARYVVAQPMTAFFDAGEIPDFIVLGNEPMGRVVISGYMVDLSQ